MRQRLGATLTTVGAALALLGTFLPWLRSGSRNRSSYAIFDLVERIGFAPDGVISWSLRLWPLVPLVLTVAVVVAWWPDSSHRLRVTHGVLVVIGAAWVGGTGLAVSFAPDAGLFRIGVGPVVTVVGAAILVAALVLRPRESGVSAAS